MRRKTLSCMQPLRRMLLIDVHLWDFHRRPWSELYLWHEAPFQARGEACSTSTSEARLLHLSHNPVRALDYQISGPVPVSSRHGTL